MILNLVPKCVSVIAVSVLLITGCASVPTEQDSLSAVPTEQDSLSAVQTEQDSLSAVQTAQTVFKSEINRPTVCDSSAESKNTNNAAAVVNEYPLDEVPHTLLKKPMAEGTLSSGHGYRFSPTGAPILKEHKGVDYSAPTGTPVYAAGNGVIVKRYTSKSYGNYIRIEHSNGFHTAYAHMHAFADGLNVGSSVSKGEMIGNVGSTGRSSGPHLHYELIYDDKYIDPLFKYSAGDQANNN